MRAVHSDIAARKAGKERTSPVLMSIGRGWMDGTMDDHGLEWSIKYSVRDEMTNNKYAPTGQHVQSYRERGIELRA